MKYAAVLVLFAACGGDDVTSSPDSRPPIDAWPEDAVRRVRFNANDWQFEPGNHVWAEALIGGADVGDPGWCTRSDTLGCTILACQHQDSGVGAGGPNAGLVTFNGDLGSITLMPDRDGAYPLSTASELYTPGADVTINAEGADIPAFTATLTAPGPIDEATPQDLEVVAGDPYTAIWTGGSGALFVSVTVAVGTIDHVVRCPFQAADGAGTIPAELTATLPPGTGSLLVESAVTTELETSAGIVQYRVDSGGNLYTITVR